MPIVNKIPWNALPQETANRFQANFNNPIGQYGFTQVAANRNQACLAMAEQYFYVIDRVSFSASIDEGVFLEAFDPTNPVQIYFEFLSQPNRRIYPRPFPGINYKDNLAWSYWFQSTQGSDELRVSIEGILNQPAALVGVPTVYAQLSLVIYQVENLDMVTTMRKPTKENFGQFYRMGA